MTECIQLRRAGLAIDPTICLCTENYQNAECLVHVSGVPDCGHLGCIQCLDVQCCTTENRGRRLEELDENGHLPRAHMRGKHGPWCDDLHDDGERV